MSHERNKEQKANARSYYSRVISRLSLTNGTGNSGAPDIFHIGATNVPGRRSKLRTNSHWPPVSGLCGNRRYFSTDFHSSAMKLSAASPSSTAPDSTSQHPTTTPVRPIPPRQCTAAIRPRRSLSLNMSRICDSGARETAIGDRERMVLGLRLGPHLDAFISSLLHFCASFDGADTKALAMANTRQCQ